MPKRPRDKNQLGKLVVDIATGQVEGELHEPAGRAIGGHARVRSMSVERRSETAAKANAARWSGESASDQGQGALDVRPDQPIRVAFERIFEEASTAESMLEWTVG